jgi:hypothetical protein
MAGAFGAFYPKRILSWFNPPPFDAPIVYPRQIPKVVVPSFIGDSGQVFNLLMYEGAGNVVKDYSPYKNHGTLYNGVSWVDGSFGWALSFNGVDGYVEVPYSASLNPDEFSVESWAKVTGGQGTYRSVVTSRDSPARGYIIYGSNVNCWQYRIGDGSTWRILDGASIVLNEWTYLVATYKAGEMRLYVDTALYGPLAAPFSKNTARPLRVGAGATEGTPQYFFKGFIALVRIYNRALSPDEIKCHYESTKPIFT